MQRNNETGNMWSYFMFAIFNIMLSLIILFFSWPIAEKWWMDTPITNFHQHEINNKIDKKALISSMACPNYCFHGIKIKKNDSTSLSISERVAINQTVRISDAISLLGMLVAVVALSFPFIGFFALKIERKNIRKVLDEELVLHKKQVLEQTSPYIEQIALARNVTASYIADRIEEIPQDETLQISEFKNIVLYSSEIEQTLIELLNEKYMSEGLSRLTSFVAPNDILTGQFGNSLRKYLKNLYNGGFVLGNENRDVFESFIKDKLKMSVSELNE